MGRAVTTPLLFDTSVYVSILRNAAFAAEFRSRYLRDIPLTSFSSVVVQELLAGARTPRQRRQVAALHEPFERVRRIITPSHLVWKAGKPLNAQARKPQTPHQPAETPMSTRRVCRSSEPTMATRYPMLRT